MRSLNGRLIVHTVGAERKWLLGLYCFDKFSVCKALSRDGIEVRDRWQSNSRVVFGAFPCTQGCSLREQSHKVLGNEIAFNVTKESRKIYQMDVTYIRVLGWVVRLHVPQGLEEREDSQC